MCSPLLDTSTFRKCTRSTGIADRLSVPWLNAILRPENLTMLYLDSRKDNRKAIDGLMMLVKFSSAMLSCALTPVV